MLASQVRAFVALTLHKQYPKSLSGAAGALAAPLSL